jgi:KaiC/GvpD/RAD55 family RecA-like ATPase
MEKILSNSCELEMLIVAAIWYIEKIDLTQFNGDMFQDIPEKFDIVMKYRKDGNPAGNISISRIILGNDLTAELMKTSPAVIETVLDHYIKQLGILRFKQKLDRELRKGDLGPELLEEGLSIYRKREKDGNLYDLSGSLQDYINDLERRIKKEFITYELGFKQLDEYISPLEPGMFLIIKALKKTGKTNFAMKIFVNMLKKKIPCLYITSEMGYYKLIDKVLSIMSKLSSSKIRKGDLDKSDLKNATDTISKDIAGKNGFIYQTGMFDIDKISELITQTKAKIIFIDYVQMFKIDSENRAEGLEKIACQIKDLAMTKNIVAIGMSQVNKDGDTKHCLSFEEKADQVISIKTKDDSSPTVKTLDVSVDYNRFGNTGTVAMVLKKSNCDIAESDTKEEPPIKEEWYNK